MEQQSSVMDQYYISGIWRSAINDQSSITNVMLHQSSANKTFGRGKKTSIQKVIQLLRSGTANIYTIEWSYKFREWQKGIQVDFEIIDDVEHLRTKRDNKVFDNLGDLLPMKVLSATSGVKELSV